MHAATSGSSRSRQGEAYFTCSSEALCKAGPCSQATLSSLSPGHGSAHSDFQPDVHFSAQLLKDVCLYACQDPYTLHLRQNRETPALLHASLSLEMVERRSFSSSTGRARPCSAGGRGRRWPSRDKGPTRQALRSGIASPRQVLTQSQGLASLHPAALRSSPSSHSS